MDTRRHVSITQTTRAAMLAFPWQPYGIVGQMVTVHRPPQQDKSEEHAAMQRKKDRHITPKGLL
jgi:hypothetical protein